MIGKVADLENDTISDGEPMERFDECEKQEDRMTAINQSVHSHANSSSTGVKPIRYSAVGTAVTTVYAALLTDLYSCTIRLRFIQLNDDTNHGHVLNGSNKIIGFTYSSTKIHIRAVP